jgi:hypothetical protein
MALSLFVHLLVTANDDVLMPIIQTITIIKRTVKLMRKGIALIDENEDY